MLTPLILLHVLTAVGALFVGAFAFAARKGSLAHRIAGRIWVALMVTTALVSFGIRMSGSLSWIHLLSVLALAGVAASVFAAVRGRIQAHRRGMLATYISLVVAGGFTLLPGRLLGDLVWNATGMTLALR